MYSAICKFNTQKAINKNGSTDYQFQVLIHTSESSFYSSQVYQLTSIQSVGTLEFQFQCQVYNPIVVARLTLIDLQDGVYYHKQQNHFLQNTQISLQKRDLQSIIVQNGKQQVQLDFVISELQLSKYFQIPYCQLNSPNLYLFQIKSSIWQFLAIEIQAGIMFLTSNLGDRQGNLSDFIIPLVDEILIKLILRFNFDGKIHKVTIFTSKLKITKPYVKQSLFNINDIDPKFSKHFYAMIDNMVFSYTQKKQQFKTIEGVVLYSNIFANSLGFLSRYVYERNNSIVEQNLKYFQCQQPAMKTENPKLLKQFTIEYNAIESLDTSKYPFDIWNTTATFVLQTVTPEQKSSEQGFKDLVDQYDSACAAGFYFVKPGVRLCFVSPSKFELNFQNFDIGTGNLALGNIQDQPILYSHYDNQQSLLKLLTINGKSLVQLTKKGVNLFVIFYQDGIYIEEEYRFTSQEIKSALINKQFFIERILNDEVSFRLYIHDKLCLQQNNLYPQEFNPQIIEQQILYNMNQDIIKSYYRDGSKLTTLQPPIQTIQHTYVAQKKLRDDFLAEQARIAAYNAKKLAEKLERERIQQELEQKLEAERLDILASQQAEAQRLINEEEARIKEEVRIEEEKRQEQDKARLLLKLRLKNKQINTQPKSLNHNQTLNIRQVQTAQISPDKRMYELAQLSQKADQKRALRAVSVMQSELKRRNVQMSQFERQKSVIQNQIKNTLSQQFTQAISMTQDQEKLQEFLIKVASQTEMAKIEMEIERGLMLERFQKIEQNMFKIAESDEDNHIKTAGYEVVQAVAEDMQDKLLQMRPKIKNEWQSLGEALLE
ncbi:hypothetical protein SS50377_25612 [Spironucleus salmonicida]|uniref:Uncharacterized protein n=1 Tax=Spironucleus salmonicida TaxID=348837 RepID=V6LXW8_9EUKA|nr:hypothetical protein SS50377_25612 [Spironucleus salmonicida]|eukprot:EST49487.1 Hypothetical protein SS50377_10236 [Spironucleus salmonicida]